MTYTVKYKHVNSWFWKKLKNVKGDGIVEHSLSRFFILDDESRIEIPIKEMIFEFSNKRFFMIKKDMERSVGQPISVDSEAV